MTGSKTGKSEGIFCGIGTKIDPPTGYILNVRENDRKPSHDTLFSKFHFSSKTIIIATDIWRGLYRISEKAWKERKVRIVFDFWSAGEVGIGGAERLFVLRRTFFTPCSSASKSAFQTQSHFTCENMAFRENQHLDFYNCNFKDYPSKSLCFVCQRMNVILTVLCR